MSNATEQGTESQTQSDALLDYAKQWYHVPVLVALMAFMLATRLRALDSFRTGGGVTFRGNDPWYHFRETSYILDHFPSTMPFDPWTNYPFGTSADQFGTLFDQLVAGFILLTSFGDPSGEYIGLIMLVAAPVFVTLAAVPTYLIAARYTSRGPALVGVLVFALLPGTVLTYSLAGFYDHQAAEVFFQTLGVFSFVMALSVAQREQPVWELVADRDLDALRRPLIYSVGAGVAAALYMWAWSPGVLLVGFTGIFFAIKITSDVYHGQSPEPIAFVGSVSMIVTGLLMFVPLRSFTLGPSTDYSLLQVILPLGVGFGCIFLAVLAREWEARRIDESLYPVAVAGILVVLVAVFSSFASSLVNSVLNRIGFSAGATVRTVGEATPPLARTSAFDFIYSEYGLAFFVALAAVILLLARPLVRSDDIRDTGYVVGGLLIVGLIYLATPAVEAVADLFGTSWQVVGLVVATALLVGTTFRHRYDATKLYLLVWAAFITSAAFTQARFNYYLAVVIAVFSAIFVAETFNYIDLETAGTIKESIKNIEGWQVMAVVAVFLLLTAPLLFPISSSAWEQGNNNGPGAVTQWEGSLNWLSSETPQPGELEGHDNAMEYYGTYEYTDDYDYPPGAYGVQSWWDYGHWITTIGERIPNANPFQQGADEAADYLLAPSEQAAAEALNQKMGETDQTRYVMVDWQMVTPGSKFGAPTVFNNNVSQSDFVSTAYPVVQTEQGEQFGAPLTLRTQRYYESQMIRLYNYHGSAVEPEPVVIEPEPRTVSTQSGGQVTIQAFDQEEDVQTFGTLADAEAYVEENPGAQIGGLGAIPSERVDALKHYRLVKASESNAVNTREFRRDLVLTSRSTGISTSRLLSTSPNWVKTFERVPGATVEGTGAAPGAEVRAAVQMEIPETGSTFTYTQYATADENGNFEMTLPYSTTGYDEFGPENGYTNTSVRATGPYSFVTADGLTAVESVDEAQIVGADDSPVSVQLTEGVADPAAASDDSQTAAAEG